jgi:hypothetical protein
MDSAQLFYDDEYDALRVAIQAIGGNKNAATLLWGVNYKGGEQRVRDCLNPNRDEKFSFRECMVLARAARDVNCHAVAVYFNAETGYAPPVAISKEDEKADLDRRVLEAVEGLQRLLTKRDAAAATPPMRSVR